jgi:hypothetical protein
MIPRRASSFNRPVSSADNELSADMDAQDVAGGRPSSFTAHARVIGRKKLAKSADQPVAKKDAGRASFHALISIRLLLV